MKIKASVGLLLITLTLLGAKCETNSKAVVSDNNATTVKDGIIEMSPEMEKYTKKFETIRYDDSIRLITNNDMTFKEAVHILKTKTNMNIPVYIFLRTNNEESFKGEGEIKSKCTTERMVSLTGRELRPYIGIIIIYDGYWSAFEFNARAHFQKKNANNNSVSVTEYFYANETVFNMNGFTEYWGVLSKFDELEKGESVKGDGSSPNEIITEFDK